MTVLGKMAERVAQAMVEHTAGALSEATVRKGLQQVDLCARVEEALHMAELLLKAGHRDASSVAYDRFNELTAQLRKELQ